MALTYGFYNSLNHDRVYDADDFSEIFNGIINDGIFQSVGNNFLVEVYDGNIINVGSGRAWFNGTWTNNDTILQIAMPDAEVLYNRIDAVVIEINRTTRENTIKAVTGTPSQEPVRPTLTKTTYVHQYPLCYIYRNASTAYIRQADITNMVGSEETPFVTGILKTISLNSLLGQWEDELNRFVENKETDSTTWFENKKIEYDNWVAAQESDMINWVDENQADFLRWYDRMKDQLDEDAAGNLQHQIDDVMYISKGLYDKTITFSEDGKQITETGFTGTTTITFHDDGHITEVNVKDGNTKTKNIYFDADGTIREVMS